MKRTFMCVALVFGCLALWSPSLPAFEIITETDIRSKIIVMEQLVKKADNAIFLFDASSSMAKPYKDTNMSRYAVAKKVLADRNAYFPDLGYQVGFYLYTPWKEILPVQPYDRDKFAAALDALPESPTGPTMTVQGLKKLESVLKPLEGRTAVFLYTDGSDTLTGAGRKKPSEIAQALAEKYNVCFYIITTNDDFYSSAIFKNAANLNFCSRVIGLDQFVEYPAFHSEALFTVVAEEDIVTTKEVRVVGFSTRNALFAFDSDQLSQKDKKDLGKLADFLKQEPDVYTILAGYTDNIGTEAYNMTLSRKRAEQVADTLIKDYGVDRSRVLTFWDGMTDPAASNATPEGRQLNRRVEILVVKK